MDKTDSGFIHKISQDELEMKARYLGKTGKELVECRGKQQCFPSEEFGVSSFPIQQKNDELKREYAKKRGIKLV